jgi:hypothetical protein
MMTRYAGRDRFPLPPLLQNLTPAYGLETADLCIPTTSGSSGLSDRISGTDSSKYDVLPPPLSGVMISLLARKPKASVD